MLQRAIANALERMLRPIDVAWLAAFRILFGLTMCVSMLRFIAFNWIDAYFVTPTFHFKYYGFSWVEPLPPALMHAGFWLLAALALCVALGLFFRFSAWVFAIGLAYVQLIDVTTYLNHYYLAGLLSFLLALTPANRAWSLDVLRKPELASATIPAGFHWLMRFQVGVVYTFAGIAKATSDWLVHHQPLRIWLGSHTDMPLFGVLFRQVWAAPVMSWTGFLFDTTIVWWLLYRRTRPFAFLVVIAFHAMTSALFPIGMFPVIMVVSALMFFPPGWPRALLKGAPAARPQRAVEPRTTPGMTPRMKHRIALAAGALYGLVHVLVPLRHFAYDGSVLWHEQGMRFSWRVMVREKNGRIDLLARDKQTGQQRILAPRRYLTRWQEAEMWGQPDLILQLAHHVHDTLERDTGHPFEVRADALVSLNGRRARPLIDPSVDLAQVQDGLGQASWITASPVDPPPHLRPVRRADIAQAPDPRNRRNSVPKNAAIHRPTSG